MTLSPHRLHYSHQSLATAEQRRHQRKPKRPLALEDHVILSSGLQGLQDSIFPFCTGSSTPRTERKHAIRDERNISSDDMQFGILARVQKTH